MKHKLLFTVFLLLALGCMLVSVGPDDIFAWKSIYTFDGVNALKWSSAAIPVKYYINPDGFPSQAVISSAQAAFTTWDNAGSKARAEYGGTTTNNTITSSDLTNIVVWIGADYTGDTSTIELDEDTLAICSFAFYNSGQMFDADIYFNGIDHTWSTDGSPGKYDVQNVLTHEIGHFWGLDDLYDDASSKYVMYGYASPGEISKRQLNQDDINGIIAIYGASPTLTATQTPRPSPTPLPDITPTPTPTPTPLSSSGANLSVRCTKNYLPTNELYLGDTFGVEVKVQASKTTSGGLAEGLPADGYVSIQSSEQEWELFLTSDMLGNLVFSPNPARLVYSWKVTSVDWCNIASITIPAGDSSYTGIYALNGYLVPNGAHYSSIAPSVWIVEVK